MALPGGLSVLDHRDFRLFWTSQFVSLVGTWMQSLAVGLCQILFMAGCNPTLQITAPDALRGRAMSLYT